MTSGGRRMLEGFMSYSINTPAPDATTVIRAESALPQDRHAHRTYPTIGERIAASEKRVRNLTALAEQRRMLAENTADLLKKRRDAHEKTCVMLKHEREKLERLTERASHPEKVSHTAERAKFHALMEKLQASGKTIDEVLQALE